MKVDNSSDKIYAIIGNPILQPVDGDARAWADAMLDILVTQVEAYHEQSPSIPLEIIGLGCIVSQMFDVEAKAKEVTQQLNDLGGGEILFSVLEMNKGDDAVNERNIQECGVSVSVMGSAPWSSSTHLFLTDEEYTEIVEKNIKELDGEIYTVYAFDVEEAEEAVWDFIDEDEE